MSLPSEDEFSAPPGPVNQRAEWIFRLVVLGFALLWAAMAPAAPPRDSFAQDRASVAQTQLERRS